MGQLVQFGTDTAPASGYFAPADNGGPGVIVIQEWWGLVPHIENVCDRFAAAGFSALAPDFYNGVSTTEPDEAGKLMMALNLTKAAEAFTAGIEFLQSNEAVTSAGVGVVGFCMGGGLCYVLAAREPESVVAVAPFYGLIPWADAAPDYSKIQAPIRGHYAEFDEYFTPELVAALQAQLDELGKDAILTVHPGTQHAFCNDDRPEVYSPSEAEAAFNETFEFFRSTIR